SPQTLQLVKFLGALYLAYLGATAIRSSFVSAGPDLAGSLNVRQSPRKALLHGFLTNGLNPKATLFFLALFTVVIDSGTPVVIQAFYGLYLSLATFAWFAMLSLVLGAVQ